MAVYVERLSGCELRFAWAVAGSTDFIPRNCLFADFVTAPTSVLHSPLGQWYSANALVPQASAEL